MKRDGSTIGPKRTKIEAKRTLTKKTRSVQATPPAIKNRRDKAIKIWRSFTAFKLGPVTSIGNVGTTLVEINWEPKSYD